MILAAMLLLALKFNCIKLATSAAVDRGPRGLSLTDSTVAEA